MAMTTQNTNEEVKKTQEVENTQVATQEQPVEQQPEKKNCRDDHRSGNAHAQYAQEDSIERIDRRGGRHRRCQRSHDRHHHVLSPSASPATVRRRVSHSSNIRSLA